MYSLRELRPSNLPGGACTLHPQKGFRPFTSPRGCHSADPLLVRASQRLRVLQLLRTIGAIIFKLSPTRYWLNSHVQHSLVGCIFSALKGILSMQVMDKKYRVHNGQKAIDARASFSWDSASLRAPRPQLELALPSIARFPPLMHNVLLKNFHAIAAVDVMSGDEFQRLCNLIVSCDGRQTIGGGYCE